MLGSFLIGLVIAAPPVGRASETAFWGPVGHRVVAAVALELLTPGAREKARLLLGDSSFAGVASWADDVRSVLPETASWHYVNIPLDAPRYDRAAHCPTGNCVVEVIRFERAVLADTTAPKSARLDALKYLIHFVGDLHQPLHVSDRHDRGGNDLMVDFVDRGPTRLHQVWDTGILEAAGWTEDNLLSTVTIEARQNRSRWAGTNPVEWVEDVRPSAREAYRIPASNKIDQGYVTRNAKVVVTLLAKAAVHLADLLDDALDPR